MLPLRAEIEFAMRGNSEKTWSDGGVNVRDVKGTWNNSTLFANLFWDFHNDSAFTPYIGAGLGLAIAAEIARRHGVTISVASEEGRGTVFTFAFPSNEA